MLRRIWYEIWENPYPLWKVCLCFRSNPSQMLQVTWKDNCGWRTSLYKFNYNYNKLIVCRCSRITMWPDLIKLKGKQSFKCFSYTQTNSRFLAKRNKAGNVTDSPQHTVVRRGTSHSEFTGYGPSSGNSRVSRHALRPTHPPISTWSNWRHACHIQRETTVTRSAKLLANLLLGTAS